MKMWNTQKDIELNVLSEKLNTLSKEFDVTNFNWTIPDNCPIEIPECEVTSFEKNVYLKNHLSTVLKEDVSLASHYWVIQDWGGIASFKKNERNNKKIIKFEKELVGGKLTRDSFNTISSLSKIASFIYPETYVIYDSRVIYALNWLLFNYSDSHKFFPQPIGRNADLIKYDMQTIFRLSGRKFEYYSHKEAFHEYCRLIKELSNNREEPYLLEMLLFYLAPTWVVDDIKQSVSIQILG